MKKFYFYVIVFGLLIGCNKEEKQQVEESYVEVVENAISVVNQRGQLEALKITFKATIDAKTEEIIGREVSQNLLDVLGLKTQEEFFTLIDEKIQEENRFEYQALNLSDDNNYDEVDTNDFSLTDCIKGCINEYTNPDGTKIRGRGACKFTCYLEKAIEVAEKLLEKFLEKKEEVKVDYILE